MIRTVFARLKGTSRTVLLLVFTLALLSAYGSSVGSPNRPSMIRQPVDDSNRTPLKGNTRPEANAKNDGGRVPDDFLMEHLLLQLRRPPEQEQALEQFIDQLHPTNSRNFNRGWRHY